VPKHSSRATIELEIADVAFGGAGVGRFDGKAVFVPFTIDGEIVEVEIIERRKRFDRAVARKMVKPSSRRVLPPCPYFGRCGGCDYQHIDYSHQLELKWRQVNQALQRIALLKDIEVSSTIAAPNPFGYRNRITVHAEEGRIGFFEKKSRRVLDINRCAIASPLVNQLLSSLRQRGLRDGEHRTLRENETNQTFTQINDAVADLLLAYVRSRARGKTLVDAYAGSGFFGHGLALQFARVVGIEWNEPAVRIAKSQAGANEDYICAGVGEALEQVLVESRPDCLLLDPSSEGIDEKAVQAILHYAPPQIVYVSCNPPILARDLGKLVTRFRIESVQPVDMFPQTAEIEVVAVLSRK
jgi:tRNA/tmRNA/rRNA uracil-C5-methylase (TrmA/RlmC/RlmD family)